MGNAAANDATSGEGYADALCATPFAKKLNAPILLTPGGNLNSSVSAELSRLKAKKVYIIGGNGSISQKVENSVKAMNITTERISGIDRYATSLEIAKRVNTESQVFLCSGSNFPDSLSISSYAAANGNSILLAEKSGPDSAIRKYISDNKSKVYVIGGAGVIQDSILNSISGAERISGLDRYATNLAVINKFSSGFKFSNIYLASGENYSDAACGAALAGTKQAPAILTNGNISNAEKAYVKSQLGKVNTINVLGGEGVISNDTLNKIPPIHRIDK